MRCLVDEKRAVTGEFKTAEQGAATSMWCATSVQLDGKGGMPIKDEATAKPFRLATAQPQAMRHAGACEPMMSRQARQVRFIDRVGADPEKPVGQFLRN